MVTRSLLVDGLVPVCSELRLVPIVVVFFLYFLETNDLQSNITIINRDYYYQI